MNNIVESQLDSALADIVAALISYVFANLLIVFLVVVVIACVIGLVYMNSKRKYTAYLLKRAAELQQVTASRLSTVLVTDTFKDLELGLAEGDTERSLQRMQKAAFGLHEEAITLGVKLKEHRPVFFSPLESLHQAEELEMEAEDLHERVERYLNDLSAIEQSARSTGQQVRQLKEQLDSVKRKIGIVGEESGYSLDKLRQQLEQVEAEFARIDQLAAFDAVQAKPESVRLERHIDTLRIRTDELQKNITIMEQIRARLHKQEEKLLLRIEQEQLIFAGDSPITIVRKTDPIMEKLDTAIRSGDVVDLRAAASSIEIILQAAVDLVEEAN